MAVVFIALFIMGCLSAGYGLFLLFLGKICDTEGVAKFMPTGVTPDKAEPYYYRQRSAKYFVYEKDGETVIAHVQNIPYLSEVSLSSYERDADYTVYVSSKHPKILITTRKLSFWQVLLAVCCLLMAILFFGMLVNVGYLCWVG